MAIEDPGAPPQVMRVLLSAFHPDPLVYFLGRVLRGRRESGLHRLGRGTRIRNGRITDSCPAPTNFHGKDSLCIRYLSVDGSARLSSIDYLEALWITVKY